MHGHARSPCLIPNGNWMQVLFGFHCDVRVTGISHNCGNSNSSSTFVSLSTVTSQMVGIARLTKGLHTGNTRHHNAFPHWSCRGKSGVHTYLSSLSWHSIQRAASQSDCSRRGPCKSAEGSRQLAGNRHAQLPAGTALWQRPVKPPLELSPLLKGSIHV
jgi:hypothetical protein